MKLLQTKVLNRSTFNSLRKMFDFVQLDALLSQETDDITFTEFKQLFTEVAFEEFVYDRRFSSKNCRKAPASIRLWLRRTPESFIPLTETNALRLQKIFDDIFCWCADKWLDILCHNEEAETIVRIKSDFFWESLAQHFSERVFGCAYLTDPVYIFGPDGCSMPEIDDVSETIIKMSIEGGTDPLNPPKRDITYATSRGNMIDPTVFLEVEVPNKLLVVDSSHLEFLDLRPSIAGNRDAFQTYKIRIHIPSGRRSKFKNTDYPDFNLVYIPLRHLVFQGDVEDPKGPIGCIDYPNLAALFDAFQALVAKLRRPESSVEVVEALSSFITEKYYYSYIDDDKMHSSTTSAAAAAVALISPTSPCGKNRDSEGLPHFCVEKFGLQQFRNYILGSSAGVGRGLSPDFGDIQLVVDGIVCIAKDDSVP